MLNPITPRFFLNTLIFGHRNLGLNNAILCTVRHFMYCTPFKHILEKLRSRCLILGKNEGGGEEINGRGGGKKNDLGESSSSSDARSSEKPRTNEGN